MSPIGPLTITERIDVALASVAARRGPDGRSRQGGARRQASRCPARRAIRQGTPYSAFWVTPEMWFVEAPFATHERSPTC